MQKNQPERANDASESEVIAALEAELRDFMLQKEQCAARIKELLFAENPSAGIVYAKDIFTMQQDKLRLQVEADCRRNKINRIRMFGLASELSSTPKKITSSPIMRNPNGLEPDAKNNS